MKRGHGCLASIKAEDRFQPLKSSGETLAKFAEDRARFLAELFRKAKKAKTWYTVDLASVSAEIGEPRERLVMALNYLEEQGDLRLTADGLRHGYRIVQMPHDPDALAFRRRVGPQLRPLRSLSRRGIPDLPPPRRRVLGPGEEAILHALKAEGHEALAAPRQMARFLCGISSPQQAAGASL